MFGIAIVLLIVPSLFEELLFRGVLHPARQARHRLSRILLAAGLFVLWHPLQFWTGLGPPWSSLFAAPDFLLTVSVAALALGILREVSGSIWPPVALHWVMVCGWKFAFGGPF